MADRSSLLEARPVLVFEGLGVRVEYPELADQKVRQILRNQDWLRRNWCAPDCPWPGDSWRLV